MIRLQIKDHNWSSILIIAVLLLAFGYILSQLHSDWHWINYPFHAMVESVGSLCAMIIATLIIIMVNNNHLAQRYIIIACGLIGMGLLDGFHAILHTGKSFVWLHSIATLFGGIIFAAVWLPDSWLRRRHLKIFFICTVVGSVLTGVVSLLFPQNLPAMIINGEFSLLARIINITGGIGFLAATVFFVHYFYSPHNTAQFSAHRQNEGLVFANHSLLFGIAGLLFETTVLWDAGWWWWHILRFIAYFVVLVYFFVLFNRSQQQLMLNEINLEKINSDLEQRVLERTYELENATKAKSDFLSSMSHELRTPLNAIIGFGQLLELEEHKFTDSQKDNIKEILDAGHHLLHLINEILDLSTIEAGKIDISMEHIQLEPLIQHSLTMISTLAAERHISIIDNRSYNEIIVHADPKRLKQVLINILSNAVKYNCVHGTITLSDEIIRDKLLRIYISDTGQGLDKEQISSLFVPFNRLNAPDHIQGTGIGLSISQNFMELMHGQIGVDSTPGVGSTFYIELEIS